MGGNTVVGGRIVPGGISYSNLEALNLNLGFGANHLTIASTHNGSTTVTSGKGNDHIDVQTVAGFTSVETGAGDDTVTVSNSGLVDQITGLLTLDTGAGPHGPINLVDSPD